MRPIVGTVSAAVRVEPSSKLRRARGLSPPRSLYLSWVPKKSISVPRFIGGGRSCLCQLLLLVGAIAKAKATAGTVPCEVNHSAHAATDGTSCAFSAGVLLVGSVEAKI